MYKLQASLVESTDKALLVCRQFCLVHDVNTWIANVKMSLDWIPFVVLALQ